MNFVFIIYGIDAVAQLPREVFELNELLALLHLSLHLCDLQSLSVDQKALGSEVNVQKPPEEHYLVL